MRKYSILATLVVAAAYLLVVAFQVHPVQAQTNCQNQVCNWDGHCFGCTFGEGFHCSPELKACPKMCTIGACEEACPPGGGPGCILPFLGLDGLGHELCGVARLAEVPLAEIAEAGASSDSGDGEEDDGEEEVSAQPAIVGVLPMRGAPARLAETTHTTKDLLAGGRLRNCDRAIIAYRLGWVFQIGSERPKVELGDWVPVSSGLAPKADTQIPSQHVPFSLIKRGAARVEFFVAGVVFAEDASKWEADLEEIRRAPSAADPNR